MDKIGWKSMVIKSGRYKDVGNPMREMTTEEKHLLQGLIDNVHKQFVRAVAEGRKMDPKAIEPLADGRLFTGEEAKAHGLIDRLGNFQDALDRAGELAGIKGKPVVIYPEEKKLRIWKLLLQNVSEWVGHYSLEHTTEDRYGCIQIH
jgi:protease-4